MLWRGTCCGGAHVEEGHMLCRGTCCGGAHVEEGHMLWRGTCCGGAHAARSASTLQLSRLLVLVLPRNNSLLKID